MQPAEAEAEKMRLRRLINILSTTPAHSNDP